MILSHEWKLALDDPASRFIPDFPEVWKGVTVRQLMSHTSGIPDYADPAKGPHLGCNYTRAELIARLARQAVEFKPGEGWAYNDFGYFFLGMIIEKAGGLPCATYLTEHTFRPLGMESTKIYDVPEVVAICASSYTWKDGKYLRARLAGAKGAFAAGDIKTGLSFMEGPGSFHFSARMERFRSSRATC